MHLLYKYFIEIIKREPNGDNLTVQQDLFKDISKLSK